MTNWQEQFDNLVDIKIGNSGIAIKQDELDRLGLYLTATDIGLLKHHGKAFIQSLLDQQKKSCQDAKYVINN